MSEPSLSPLSNATQPPASVVSLTSSEEVTAFLNEAVSDVNGSQEDNDDRSQDRTYQPSEASGDDTASQGTQVGREMGGVSDGNSTMIRVPRVRVQQGSISGSIFGGMDNSDFQERMAAILQMINELNEATRTMRNQVQRLHDSRNRARTGRETVMAHHILPAIREMTQITVYMEPITSRDQPPLNAAMSRQRFAKELRLTKAELGRNIRDTPVNADRTRLLDAGTTSAGITAGRRSESEDIHDQAPSHASSPPRRFAHLLNAQEPSREAPSTSTLRARSEPPLKAAHAPDAKIATPAGEFQLHTRAFRDKGSEGFTSWFSSTSGIPIMEPPPYLDATEGTLYIHTIRGSGTSHVWMMKNQSWISVKQGCDHPFIKDRCLRLRGSGEPSWVLKCSMATMNNRKERANRT
ncbi:hypothetical protein ONZ45_g8125 [Pleurotus djamor]|nr:hypothetical protein ONZ45_g8125 [Pleurotus djamor]